MRVLSIVSSAYRATVEEQDDTVIWFTHAIKGAGADVDMLLKGPAVNYAVMGQAVAPVTIGTRTQRQGPDVCGQVAGLIGKGVQVFVAEVDLERRGLAKAPLIDGARRVRDIPALFSEYDRVWHW